MLYDTTGIMRSATKEDIGLFKCMHGEEMVRMCRELSAKVSQPFCSSLTQKVYCYWVCVGVYLSPSRKGSGLKPSPVSMTLRC